MLSLFLVRREFGLLVDFHVSWHCLHVPCLLFRYGLVVTICRSNSISIRSRRFSRSSAGSPFALMCLSKSASIPPKWYAYSDDFVQSVQNGVPYFVATVHHEDRTIHRRCCGGEGEEVSHHRVVRSASFSSGLTFIPVMACYCGVRSLSRVASSYLLPK